MVSAIALGLMIVLGTGLLSIHQSINKVPINIINYALLLSGVILLSLSLYFIGKSF